MIARVFEAPDFDELIDGLGNLLQELATEAEKKRKETNKSEVKSERKTENKELSLKNVYVVCENVQQYQDMMDWYRETFKSSVKNQVLIIDSLNTLCLGDGKLYPRYCVKEGDRLISYAEFKEHVEPQTGRKTKEIDKKAIEKAFSNIEKEISIIRNLLK